MQIAPFAGVLPRKPGRAGKMLLQFSTPYETPQ